MLEFIHNIVETFDKYFDKVVSDLICHPSLLLQHRRWRDKQIHLIKFQVMVLNYICVN